MCCAVSGGDSTIVNETYTYLVYDIFIFEATNMEAPERIIGTRARSVKAYILNNVLSTGTINLKKVYEGN